MTSFIESNLFHSLLGNKTKSLIWYNNIKLISLLKLRVYSAINLPVTTCLSDGVK